MSDEQDGRTEPDSKVAEWLVLGITFGAALGVALDNLGLGISFGTALGLIVGGHLDALRRS